MLDDSRDDIHPSRASRSEALFITIISSDEIPRILCDSLTPKGGVHFTRRTTEAAVQYQALYLRPLFVAEHLKVTYRWKVRAVGKNAPEEVGIGVIPETNLLS